MTDRPKPSTTQTHRLDPPHQPGGGPDLPSEVERPQPQTVKAAAGLLPETLDEQLQLQGHQLAMELVKRQREIDRREGQFNAYLATLENESRSARLQTKERDASLATREQEYQLRLAELIRREAELPLDGQSDPAETEQVEQLRLRKEELDERALRLEAGEKRLTLKRQQFQTRREASMQLVRRLMRMLERRRAAIEEQAARVQSHPLEAADTQTSPSTELATNDLPELVEQLQAERQAIDAEREELADHRRALELGQRQLQQERAQWEDNLRRQQQRHQKQQALDSAELQQKQQALQSQASDLSKRGATLDQLQSQITDTHREALELRLATEQLWSQLAEAVPPAELADTLAQLRSQIAEHHREQEQSLMRGREELQQMAARLDSSQLQIRKEREELQEWTCRRQEEIEYQAARLVAHEHQLQSQQTEHQQASARWDQQRHEYESEIRQLQARLRQTNRAAA